MSGIVAENVRRSFGQVHAVSDATFRAEAGRVTGLVGPNGAGKTTLLLMLASLLAPDAGSIRIGEVDPVVDPAAARRMLGWMPDALGAWPSLTARESIVTTARLHDMSAVDAAGRADELLRIVGLAEHAGSPARVLSRGQKQKLGLARALVHDPQVLLLDEPASGLDPEARVQLRIMLRGLAAQGKTVLISSHVLSELEEVIDDAVFMVAGAVVDPVAARTSRAYRVRLAAPDAVAAVSAALELPVEQVGNDRGDALVSFTGDAGVVEGLRRLVSAGLPVLEFSPAQSALEASFLALQHPTPSTAPAGPAPAASPPPPAAAPPPPAPRADPPAAPQEGAGS
ncbi:ABC transporter ATP-binding protein [Microbacterium sp. H1-D42]|uniref:ABC transporter ATP-binding protein n=1 Tax=Microbacterium sp. H1-D42 TaxID=2925844 RepID=UPI001F52F4ED|nr:ABC transporter ATP-binding protein [Microbacterium sp. H1-D42]UNK70047.1 ABC transporter ATP-binding protein [Microbacterium sp. H1-D42]